MKLISSSSLIEHRSLSLLGLPTTVIGLPGHWANKKMMLAPGGSSSSGNDGPSREEIAARKAEREEKRRRQKVADRKMAEKKKMLKAARPNEVKYAIELYTKWINRNKSKVIRAVLRGIERYLKQKPLSRRLMGEKTGGKRKAKIYHELFNTKGLSKNEQFVILYAFLKTRHVGKSDVANYITKVLLKNDTEKLFRGTLSYSLKFELSQRGLHDLSSKHANSILVTILNKLLPEVIGQVIYGVCRNGREIFLKIEQNVVGPIIAKVDAKQDPENDFDDILDELKAVFLSDKALEKGSSKESRVTREEKQWRQRTQMAVELCKDWIEVNKAKVIALAQQGIEAHLKHKSSLQFFKSASLNKRKSLIYQKLLNGDDINIDVRFLILCALLLYPKQTPGKLQNDVARHIMSAFLAANHKGENSLDQIEKFPTKFLVEVIKRIVVSTVDDERVEQLQHYVRLIAIHASCVGKPRKYQHVLKK